MEECVIETVENLGFEASPRRSGGLAAMRKAFEEKEAARRARLQQVESKLRHAWALAAASLMAHAACFLRSAGPVGESSGAGYATLRLPLVDQCCCVPPGSHGTLCIATLCCDTPYTNRLRNGWGDEVGRR